MWRLQATLFSPEHVYTFHIRQHVVDLVNFRVLLPIPMWQPALARHLDGQPLRFMAVHRETGEHFWNFEARFLHCMPSLRATLCASALHQRSDLHTCGRVQTWHKDLLEAARKHYAEDVAKGVVAAPNGHADEDGASEGAELVQYGSIDEMGADLLTSMQPPLAVHTLAAFERLRSTAHRDACACCRACRYGFAPRHTRAVRVTRTFVHARSA